MAARSGVITKLVAHLATVEAGQTVSVEHLSKVLSLTESQVATGMYRLMRDDRLPVAAMVKGKLWRRLADNTPAPESLKDDSRFHADVVEKAGGHLILRDQEGYLYLAKRIGLAED